MKKEFSKHWISSKQPRKQRKFVANAPLHVRKKFVSANLSKELRKKHEKRNIPLRKGDVVKIMRGKFKGKRGKVTLVELKKLKINVEGIQVKKRDGSKVNIALKPSNLQIVELYLDDRKRNKALKKTDEKPKEKKKSEVKSKDKKDMENKESKNKTKEDVKKSLKDKK